MKKYENQTLPVEQQLDQILKSIKKKVQSNTIQQNESENFENPDLRKFMPKDTTYTPETGNKVLLDAASIEALVAILFNINNKEPHFVDSHIFAWHNANLNLKTLIEQFTILCTLAGTQKQIAEGVPNLSSTDAATIIKNYLLLWIKFFPQDFLNKEDKPDLSELLPIIEQNGVEIEDLKNKLEDLLLMEENNLNPPTPLTSRLIIEKPLTKSELLSIFITEGNPNDEIPLCLFTEPNIIAQHFTRIEIEIFNSIQYREFLKCSWSKPNREETSPNLTKLTQRFNNTCSFISYTLVKEKNLMRRACVLVGWIRIMEQVLSLDNFNLIFEIDGSLNNPAITRLTQTWKKISEISPGIKEVYEELSRLTSAFRKFGR